MSLAVELIYETEKGRPPRVQNTFSGQVTTEEVVSSIHDTVEILNQQSEPIDVIAIFEEGSSMLSAKGILGQARIIDQLTWHPKLDQVIAVELNKGLYGSFIKTLLNAAKNQPGLKVTVFGTMRELDQYLTKKYAAYKEQYLNNDDV